ncbi:MAG: hypothetical protein NTZ80_04435 [Patescibacteria group bacterium]|nr:hypothetical protein [Patescibacteria group bacterium]
MNESLSVAHRTKRTQPIRSADQIEWEFVYAELSAETENALDEAIDVIARFGVEKGYFGIFNEMESMKDHESLDNEKPNIATIDTSEVIPNFLTP